MRRAVSKPRQAFEAWVCRSWRKGGWTLQRNASGQYEDFDVWNAWMAFRAGYRLRRKRQTPEMWEHCVKCGRPTLAAPSGASCERCTTDPSSGLNP